MTRCAAPMPFTFAQISPPEAYPSRLRALRAHRQDKGLAAQPLHFKGTPSPIGTTAASLARTATAEATP